MRFFSRIFVTGDDNTGWVKIIIQSLGFAEKLRAEDDIFLFDHLLE